MSPKLNWWWFVWSALVYKGTASWRKYSKNLVGICCCTVSSFLEPKWIQAESKSNVYIALHNFFIIPTCNKYVQSYCNRIWAIPPEFFFAKAGFNGRFPSEKIIITVWNELVTFKYCLKLHLQSTSRRNSIKDKSLLVSGIFLFP